MIMVISGIFLLNQRREDFATPPAKKPVDVAKEEAAKTLIDLRPFEPDESPNDRRSQAVSITLQRANQRLTIQLPVGSEEGRYLVQLLGPSGMLYLETSGNATIQNYVTTLEALLDLRSVSPGPFKLSGRREGTPASTSCRVEVR